MADSIKNMSPNIIMPVGDRGEHIPAGYSGSGYSQPQWGNACRTYPLG